MKKVLLIFLAVLAVFNVNARAQKPPLRLLQTIPLPGLHDGDFDHFAVDLRGHRLFLAAEENAAVEVFDLHTNKLIHTITDVKAPHSLLYRGDLNKLFVIDGDAAECKIYQSDSYKPLGAIKLAEDADSATYDPATQYLYVVDGGREAHTPYSFISIVDTTHAKKLADIKVDANRLEAMAIEKSGPRLFVNITAQNAVGVIDRKKRALVGIWSVGQEGQENVPLAFDEANHRLFVVTRKPAKLIVLDTGSGKVVTSLPCVDLSDDAVYDARQKRLYIAGDGFINVFQQRDADHYDLIGKTPTSFRAKTAILVSELNRYYLAVPHHGDNSAEVRVYEVVL
jgi:DNA-binding beta-propeller fold protein YncE